MAGESKVLVIDNDLRTIKIPEGVTHLGVECDDDVLGLEFQMPRTYNGIDLSTFDIRINYFNANGDGGADAIKNKTIVNDSITFTWFVSRFASAVKGDVEFNVCLKKLSGTTVVKEFNTTPAKLPILKGLETTERIKQEYPDILEEWHQEILGKFSGKIDKTLTKSGMAADSAETGKKLSEIASVANSKASSLEVNTERTRIDKIISGQTDINANSELVDIRVGFDGSTYGSAGSAVRTQISDLRKTVFDEMYFSYGDVESGNGFINAKFELQSDATWFTSDYITISKNSVINYCLEEYPTLPHIVFYDENKNVVGSAMGVNRERLITNTVIPSNNAVYFRYVMYILDGLERASSQYVRVTTDLLYEVKEDISELHNKMFDEKTFIYNSNDEVNGYVRKDDVFIDDDNWHSSDYIDVAPYDSIDYILTGHTIVSSITIYDEDKLAISRVVAETNNKQISGAIIVPKNGCYIRYVMSHMRLESDIFQRLKIVSNNLITALNNDGLPSDVVNNIIHPRCIYTVANDVGGHDNNMSACIYLDHHFNGLTSEYNIRYDNGKLKRVFFSPLKVEDSNETNPAITCNDGLVISEKTNTIKITHNDNSCYKFDILHRSVLNSRTLEVTPRVLCIGDSITYGELATMPDDGFASNFAYHLLAAEMFKKDSIRNGGSGSNCIFLGTMKRVRTMKYNDVDYQIVTHHEGRRGWSYNAYMSDGSPFYDSENNMFSINKWLSDYRTMDDTGERLMIGDGTGTLITSSNLNDIDVCTPTHILIMLGANGGQTTEQYLKMVDDIKTEHPNMIIGLTVSDSAGTYFPSLHRHTGEELAFWVDGTSGEQAGRHNTMFNCMKNIIDEFDNETYENNNVYVLPFYFVQPTAESCAMRVANGPSYYFDLMKDSDHYITKYGWCPTTHINGIGHANWAYQLYSWLKYTIAKDL